jgi:hypothetical protein
LARHGVISSGGGFCIMSSASTQAAGSRQLVVIYEKGGYGGGKEFAAGIPKAWTDQDVENLIFWPMKDPWAPYPAWEVPTRVHGKPVLFKFWKDEKSDL